MTQTQYVYPPAIYTVACGQSKFTGSTYGDAVLFLRVVMKERDMCAGKIDKIREWEAARKRGENAGNQQIKEQYALF